MTKEPSIVTNRRIWAMIIAAPSLWLGLWLAGRTLGGLIPPWVTLVADIILLMWVLTCLRSEKRGLTEIGLTTDWLRREAVIGLLVGLGLWIFAQIPGWLLRLIGIDFSYGSWLIADAPTRWFYAIGIGVCEEIIWRGYALTELHRLYRLSVSVVLAVVAFVVFHGGEAVLIHWMILPLMVYVGGWLCALSLWRRSLTAPIVARIVLGGLGLV